MMAITGTKTFNDTIQTILVTCQKHRPNQQAPYIPRETIWQDHSYVPRGNTQNILF